jgi:putative sterol carrier protein
MAEKYAFLSPEWLDAVRNMPEGPGGVPADLSMSMNQVVTDIPPSGEQKTFHMILRDGSLDWDEGELEGAEVTMTLDYETAKEVLIGGDPQAGIQAFMQGKIRVTGDMSKLMSMQSGGPAGGEFATALREITE